MTSPLPPAPSDQPEPFAAPFTAPQPPPGYGPPFAPQHRPVHRAPRPPQPPTNWKLIGGMAVGIVAVAAACTGVLASGEGRGGPSRSYDVRIASCKGSDGSGYDIVGAQAEVEVVNNTSRTHSYTVTVAYTDSTGKIQYATGTAFINDLAPGQTGRATSTSWQGGNVTIDKCKITRVTESIF